MFFYSGYLFVELIDILYNWAIIYIYLKRQKKDQVRNSAQHKPKQPGRSREENSGQAEKCRAEQPGQEAGEKEKEHTPELKNLSTNPNNNIYMFNV